MRVWRRQLEIDMRDGGRGGDSDSGDEVRGQRWQRPGRREASIRAAAAEASIRAGQPSVSLNVSKRELN